MRGALWLFLVNKKGRNNSQGLFRPCGGIIARAVPTCSSFEQVIGEQPDVDPAGRFI